MKKIASTALIACFALTGPALAENKPTEEQIAQIMEMLESMRCEMDDADIEIDGDEIELDDVFCGGGQLDIDLNEEMHITGMRAE